jgi:hypothetical protein
MDSLTLKGGPIGYPEISVNSYQYMPHNQGCIQVLWGLKLLQFLGPTLRKRIRSYEYKIRYESEYLFRMRKEITTNYKLKKLTNTNNITKSIKITQLIHCLTYLYNTFFIHSLSAYYLIVSLYDNDFVI